MANFLLTTHGTGGDVLPFVRIGWALKKRGHRVTIFTHSGFKDVAESAGLEFVPWDTLQEHNEFIQDLPLLADPVNRLPEMLQFYQRHHNVTKCVAEYEKIKQCCEPRDTILVARHLSSISALIAAEKLQIPVASVFLAPNYVSHMPLHEELFGEIMARDVNRIREALDLKPIPQWTAWLCSPAKRFGLWPEWFASSDPLWPVTVTPIGFPLGGSGLSGPTDTADLPDEVRAFLDQGEPPLIITAGTSRMIDSRFYHVSIEACRMAGERAIVVCQYPDNLPSIQHLPDGIRWFPSIPLVNTLPYGKAVIHHGGIGTLSEALAAGIPQLILPHLTDRPDNAGRIQRFEFIKALPPVNWIPQALVQAIIELSGEESRKDCREFALKMKEQDPMTGICEALEGITPQDRIRFPEAVSETVSGSLNIPGDSPKFREDQKDNTAASIKGVEGLSPEMRLLLLEKLRGRQTKTFQN